MLAVAGQFFDNDNLTSKQCSAGEAEMVKFEFSLKTREGQKVDRIVIMGKDQSDAERKLRQMYRHCNVLRCEPRSPGTLSRQILPAERLLSFGSK
jgi:hypothetical protein